MLFIGAGSGAPGCSMGLETVKDLHTGLLGSNRVQILFSAKNTGHLPESKENWALCLMTSAIQTRVSLPIPYIYMVKHNWPSQNLMSKRLRTVRSETRLHWKTQPWTQQAATSCLEYGQLPPMMFSNRNNHQVEGKDNRP